MKRFRLVLFAAAAVVGLMSSAQSLGQGLGDFPGTPSFSKKAVDDGVKVRVSAIPLKEKAGAGEATAVALTLDIAPHWHAWPAEAQRVLPANIDEFAFHTSLEIVDRPAWVAAVGEVQWPKPQPGEVVDVDNPGKTVTVPLFQGSMSIFVPVLVARDAPLGPATLTFLVQYQVCDEKQCLQPEDREVRVTFEIVAAGGASAPAAGGAFAGLDAAVLGSLKPGDGLSKEPAIPPTTQRSADGSNFFGVSLARLSGPGGFALLAILGVVGGFFLNLTPCVLPVIPIKVLTLTKHAGSPRRAVVLSAWMSLGVVAFWLTLGVPAAFVSALADPSRLFGIWWLTTGIGLLIGAMGLGILGLFSINLPQAVYMVSPEANSPTGSFLFGAMTAVLGLPCFGFVAGALLGATPTFGSIGTIVVFGAIGVGMAAPYFLLALKPGWLSRLPKSGPASELIKQVMGLLLLAAAAYFIGSGLIALVQERPYLAKLLHWWAAACFGTVAGVWLVARAFRITNRPGGRVLAMLFAALFAGGGVGAAWLQTSVARAVSWQDYSKSAVDGALADGKTVVLDFTAEWCINCKALKAAVLSVPPVKDELNRADVVAFEVDLTSLRAPGWEALRGDYRQTGIPLLVIRGPGLKEPWMSNAYTPAQVVEALAAARRTGG